MQVGVGHTAASVVTMPKEATSKYQVSGSQGTNLIHLLMATFCKQIRRWQRRESK